MKILVTISCFRTFLIFIQSYIFNICIYFKCFFLYLLASERSERDTLRSVQLRIADIYIIGEREKRARHSQVCSIENRGFIINTCNFVLITRKEGGA